MKLYYAPGACSLSPHIVLNELGYAFEPVRVDLATKRTQAGEDYRAVNPRGYVPALALDDGEVLTEGPAILQYLADRKRAAGWLAPVGEAGRYRTIAWLHFVGTELHKGFSPLWSPATPAETQAAARAKLVERYAAVEHVLAARPHLGGDAPSLADAYLFAITRWASLLALDISAYPAVRAFMQRMAARPAVQAALRTEGLLAPERAAA